MKPVLTAALLAAALGACASVPAATGAAVSVPQRADPYFEAGLAHVAAQPGAPRARNVIIFVGDGMGVTTVTATRIFAGQRQGKDGESHTLAMDTFPHVALSRTYGHDSQISDSAPTATALLSGVKTREGVIGLTSA
ncbi:MAG: alkaline phosphatase, partial [Hyphomonadaceae bacterium]|nr:alkaline phosphatase [Hyphomonadaceae bacterium]